MKPEMLWSMAIGLWIGNMLYHGGVRGKWNDGFWIGLITAVIYVIFAGVLLT